ncbi:MAG: 4Fe-4S dicluster domain-containing protein [Actinobacteria bacterium]|nr:4Fe-4S dicluster domain-containing protein [Actinomycetota bacterium]
MDNKIPIYIMGQRYEVPEGLTIMKAMEWTGHKLIRGCGCRGGFCGACGTVYRVPGDHRLKVGLACQTTVVEDMYLTELPFFPANKAIYDVTTIPDPVETLLEIYPEITRCLGCNSCTKVCPQHLRPIDFIANALRGDLEKVAEISFDCIMCGLCAARCPGDQVPYHVAMYARRVYSRSRKSPAYLAARLEQITNGTCDMPDDLVDLDVTQLKKIYNEREFEKI